MSKDKEVDSRFYALKEPFEKSAYKEVGFGRTFTSIDAYHIVERLTDVFGLCGQGWGFKDLQFEVHDKCASCIGIFWYRDSGETHEIPAVGDAAVMKGNVAEAYKKAQTNLMSKASSFIGVGLSVYQGKGIDDPYLDRAELEKSTNARRARIANSISSKKREAAEAGLFKYKIDFEGGPAFKEAAKTAGIPVKWNKEKKVWMTQGEVPGYKALS